ncbi:response regulator [Thalassotalea profundi]|uniref:DNA-binding response regulator n=1 Tax=Thalassotalea profundi TaxID=2036687 RepID=A0ABQ3IAU5_9GAMM|nr:response regulator [Thalassotalea profundi]GHE77290.1 DNA-binding response regulator [Thalassotalea profundi]
MRILLVEDDRPLAEGLQQSLRREGYSVDWVNNGKQAIDGIAGGDCELVILDLGLPDVDGITVLKEIKNSNKALPVLILTARDGIESKVTGLDLGADDYIAKPFDMDELHARLRVIERRIGTSSSALVCINNVALDTAAHSITVDNHPINLSRREYMIIKSLMENAGRIQSKSQLETRLYEWGDEVASNTIEVHISNIRKKLPKEFINTVRGVGYIIHRQ